VTKALLDSMDEQDVRDTLARREHPDHRERMDPTVRSDTVDPKSRGHLDLREMSAFPEHRDTMVVMD